VSIWFGYYLIPLRFSLPTIFAIYDLASILFGKFWFANYLIHQLFDLTTNWFGNYLIWQLFGLATI
jgi:hypothetical protein